MNFIRKKLGLKLKYAPPKFVTQYCKGKGIEIGGAAHQDFKINALNIDINDHSSENDIYAKEQMKLAGYVKKVDIIAKGDNIPLKDNSVDFVFSSHVIEHFYDPVSAINEWLRIVKPNGYIVMIIPHKKRTFDAPKPCSKIEEFIIRHNNYDKNKEYPDDHHSIWTTETFLDFAKNFKYNVVYYIDKVYRLENSFGIVIKK